MAAPTNTYTTFLAGGFGYNNATAGVNHEDLVDVVTILDSFQTPWFSSSPKVRATDVVHSWTIDTLASTSTAGSIEANDFAGSTLTNPSRLFNLTTIYRRDVAVSDREREANPAGIRDMYEHQVMKEFKVIARNAESRMWNPTASATASGDLTTAPSGAGIKGFAIVTAVSASGTVLTADIVTLSESLFNAGAEPDSIWFAPSSKRQFVNATVSSGSGNVRNIAATDQKLVANIDVFETPFNQLYAVITDRFIPMAAASNLGNGYYIGDRSMAKCAFYRPPQHKPMGKSGDNTRGIVLMELCLQLDHPSSWAVMSGVINT